MSVSQSFRPTAIEPISGLIYYPEDSLLLTTFKCLSANAEVFC